MFLVFLSCLAIFGFVGHNAEPNFGQQRCADPSCLNPLAKARTIINYRPNDNFLLGFKKSEEVKVLSKGEEYWGVEINGKRGYVHKQHLQETQVFVREPTFDLTSGQPQLPPTNADAVTQPPPVDLDPVTESPNPDPPTDDSSTQIQPEQATTLEQKPEEPGVTEPPKSDGSQDVSTGQDGSTGESPSPSHPIPTPPSEFTTELLSSMASFVESLPPSHLAGAHATQVNSSPEDMEFNRIKATYSNLNGDFVPELLGPSHLGVLQASVEPVQELPVVPLKSSFPDSGIPLFSSASASVIKPEQGFEVIDGTTFYFDEPVVTTASTLAPSLTTVDLKTNKIDQPDSTSVEYLSEEKIAEEFVNSDLIEAYNNTKTEPLKISPDNLEPILAVPITGDTLAASSLVNGIKPTSAQKLEPLQPSSTAASLDSSQPKEFDQGPQTNIPTLEKAATNDLNKVPEEKKLEKESKQEESDLNNKDKLNVGDHQQQEIKDTEVNEPQDKIAESQDKTKEENEKKTETEVLKQTDEHDEENEETKKNTLTNEQRKEIIQKELQKRSVNDEDKKQETDVKTSMPELDEIAKVKESAPVTHPSEVPTSTTLTVDPTTTEAPIKIQEETATNSPSQDVAPKDLAPQEQIAPKDLSPKPSQEEIAPKDLTPKPSQEEITPKDLTPKPSQEEIVSEDLTPKPSQEELVSEDPTPKLSQEELVPKDHTPKRSQEEISSIEPTALHTQQETFGKENDTKEEDLKSQQKDEIRQEADPLPPLGSHEETDKTLPKEDNPETPPIDVISKEEATTLPPSVVETTEKSAAVPQATEAPSAGLFGNFFGSSETEVPPPEITTPGPVINDHHKSVEGFQDVASTDTLPPLSTTQTPVDALPPHSTTQSSADNLDNASNHREEIDTQPILPMPDLSHDIKFYEPGQAPNVQLGVAEPNLGIASHELPPVTIDQQPDANQQQEQLDPNLGLNQQHQLDPNLGLNQQHQLDPNQGLNQQHQLDPNQGLNQQHQLDPNQGLNQQHQLDPNQGLNQQHQFDPNQGLNQQQLDPNQGLNQQQDQVGQSSHYPGHGHSHDHGHSHGHSHDHGQPQPELQVTPQPDIPVQPEIHDHGHSHGGHSHGHGHGHSHGFLFRHHQPPAVEQPQVPLVDPNAGLSDQYQQPDPNAGLGDQYQQPDPSAGLGDQYQQPDPSLTVTQEPIADFSQEPVAAELSTEAPVDSVVENVTESDPVEGTDATIDAGMEAVTEAAPFFDENNDSLSQNTDPTLDEATTEAPAFSPPGVVDETVQHYIESSKFFIPEWLHKSLHGRNIDTFSPRMVSLLSIISLVLLLVYVIFLVFNKLDRENPLKGKLADLDRQLFKAKNEALILKREMDVAVKSGTMIGAQNQTQVTDVHLYKELEALKAEKDQVITESNTLRNETFVLSNEKQEALAQVEQLNAKIQELEGSNQTLKRELVDYEAIVLECLEERKKQKESLFSGNLPQAIDSLREQLNSQKETMKKYEAKIKKRESELKERSQEVRKLRADVANANLKVDKITAEKDRLEKDFANVRQTDESRNDELESVRAKLSELETVRNDLIRLKEDVDVKDSELEAKIRENEVLQETLKSLKSTLAKCSRKKNNNNKGDSTSADGWEGFDDEVNIDDDGEIATDGDFGVDIDFGNVEACAQLSVDLKKAQSACEQLTEQLMKAESLRDEYELKLKEHYEELEMSRQAKEEALKERMEAEQKHSVLSTYFNKREAELQKQIGLLSARLGDSEQGSESTVKELLLLSDEVESYKAQVKSLKAEMEEQERSLKAQNVQLEKKQHEAWVAMRQETRKFADAQKEMQGLRTRLTLAEAKLVEKEVEIAALREENFGLKDSVDKISQQQGGTKSDAYSNGNLLSGPSSISSEQLPPPELPPLPMLPMLPIPPTPLAIPPMGLSSASRPPPLGRRSPPRGSRGYSRSPSPTSRYPPAPRYRDVSPARSDRSRSRYDSYDEDRYSPLSHNYTGRRHSRDWSPDSDRSDYERDRRDYLRETPARELPGRRRSSREEDFPPTTHHNYNTRMKDKRGEEKHGPKTSSPMVEPFN